MSTNLEAAKLHLSMPIQRLAEGEENYRHDFWGAEGSDDGGRTSPA